MPIKTRGQSIIVPPGISLKPTIEGSVSVGPIDINALEGEERARVTFRLEYAVDSGRYTIAAFGVDRKDLPLEVGGAFLRTVRVHRIVRIGVLRSLPIWTFPIQLLRQRRATGELLEPVDFDLKHSDSLLLAAAVYRIAEISGDRPVEAVAETLGLKLRTATNWISRARAAGHMTTTLDQRAVREAAMALIDRLGIEPDITDEEHQQFLRLLRGDDGHD